ncbi:MAG: hypothetical protein E6Q06_01775 [Candidatus Moraniibacteriota bacterium]|nr:MAG: hypothetical protein E6Q06_01775 [Candidatus Moranbacteria bacterium]
MLQSPALHRQDKEFLKSLYGHVSFEEVFLIAHGLICLDFHILPCSLYGPAASEIARYLLRIFSRPREQIRQDLLDDPFKTIKDGNILCF